MIELRPLRLEEAPLLYELEEKIWPAHIQATAEQLHARLRTFQNGVLGIWIGGRIVGFGTSQVVRLSAAPSLQELERLLPRPGVISESHTAKGNCLHLMSCGVMPEYRRRGLWTLLVQSRISLARFMSLPRVIVDSRMPSYCSRGEKYRSFSPEAYACLLDAGRPVDSYLAFFYGLGFRMMTPAHASYSDPESGECWPFMLYELETV